jgi:protein ImuA
MEDLRRLLPGGAPGLRQTLPFGLAALDSHLPEGGLTCGALHEVVPEAAGAAAAALGFIAAILTRVSPPSPPPCGERSGVGVARRHLNVDVRASPHDPHPTLPTRGRVFLVIPAYGLRHYGPPARVYGHGLRALGLDPSRLILVEPASRKEALWAMEEALRSQAPAAVVGLIDKLDLRLSQRLQLAAVAAGLPLLLLRPPASSAARGEGWQGGSAAATRWRVAPALAARDRFGLFVRARWHLVLERCRNGRTGEWTVEYDHVAHRFSLAAALADPARARGPDQNNEQFAAACHRA